MSDSIRYRSSDPALEITDLGLIGQDLIPVSGLEEHRQRKSLGDLADMVAGFSAASRSDATRKGYGSDWRDFLAFCREHDLQPLPASAETLAMYLAALASAGRKVATIRRRVVAIGAAHRLSSLPSPADGPLARSTMDGIERRLGTAPEKKAALTVDLVAKLCRKIPDDLAGLRDRALILVGFAAALRRSELVALDRADIRRHPKGLVVLVRRSKTDQKGEGLSKAIPHGRRLHVAAALDAWCDAAKIVEGAVFRGVHGPLVLADRLSGRQAARIVQARVAAIGLDPGTFGAHSLRSGFITSAADNGATLQSIAGHAGHAKLDTTMGYVQVQDAFASAPGKKFL